MRHGALVVVIAAFAAACSSGQPDLTEDARAVAVAELVALGSDVGLTFADGDAECSLNKLAQADADMLAAGQRPAGDSIQPVASAIVDCVGSEVIAASVLSGQAPTATEEELDCAASRIDDALVVNLVSSSLEQEQISRPADRKAHV